ncbi:unnamed protein product [Danaus chrysippus]|uniref:(African queen) hypothetical protein n=1 Tax=Danaus chrysippus TaxID=151541 RepID=A0A8J2W558_9NEOP|nr:unnamed protein product [Danaus chrysippus]
MSPTTSTVSGDRECVSIQPAANEHTARRHDAPSEDSARTERGLRSVAVLGGRRRGRRGRRGAGADQSGGASRTKTNA